MKKPEWWDVLEPREAVIAGVVGLAIVWPLIYYVSHTGYYLSWGYSRPQWRGIGTAIDMLGFAVPYWLVKWWVKRR
jgi:hypothetical protein